MRVGSMPDFYGGEIPVALVVLGDEAKDRAAKNHKEAQEITVSTLKARSTTAPY